MFLSNANKYKKYYLYFVNPLTNKMTVRSCNTKLKSEATKRILKKLYLSNDFKFHSLRHSSITELIKNNVPLNIVKEIAGHKSITNTMIYSHVKSNDLKQAVNSLIY